MADKRKGVMISEGSRRASGRARRRPDTYNPDAIYGVQQYGSSSSAHPNPLQVIPSPLHVPQSSEYREFSQPPHHSPIPEYRDEPDTSSSSSSAAEEEGNNSDEEMEDPVPQAEPAAPRVYRYSHLTRFQPVHERPAAFMSKKRTCIVEKFFEAVQFRTRE